MDDLEQRLRALFLEDLQDGLRALRDGAEQLGREAAGDPAEVQRELFRVAHSLKGAGHSANVPSAVEVCHRLEDLFSQLQSGQRPVDGPLLAEVRAGVEALSALEERLRGNDGDAGAPSAAVVRAQPVPAPERPVPVVTAPMTVPNAPGSPAARPVEPRLRIAVGTADELVHQVTDLVDELARAGITQRSVRQAASRLVTTSHALRLQPFAEVCAGLDRTVAEVAAAAGKQVSLDIDGGDTRIDRSLGTALREPLLHLVRNAVDHGIEPAPIRRQAGKPAAGTVRVRAGVVESNVEITVADDGAGLDVTALRAAARDRELAVDDDVSELAFVPGLSTAGEVTVVSGRGVGLDAVRDRVERLGGAVRLRSTTGRGAEVVLSVPRTLATVHVLVVQAGGTRVGLPVTSLDHVQRVDRDQLRDVGGRQVLLGEGEPVPVVSLAAALGADDAPAPGGAGTAVLVRLAAGAGGGALEVDAVEDEVDGVLRALPARLAGLPGVLGVIGLVGGALAPVLNPASCVRRGAARSRARAVSVDTRHGRRTVVLAEDTLTTRVLEQSILEAAGYDVLAAADGAEAWRLLQSTQADIVVSDVDMPNMTGIELCRAIRASGRFPGLPVVLVTSLGSDDDRRRGAEAGADAYLVKSAFDREVLLETVGRLL